jgi:hypothetical protein
MKTQLPRSSANMASLAWGRDMSETAASGEHYAYLFWPEAPNGPTIEAGKYCHMSGELYGRFAIVWEDGHPTLSVDAHEWCNFFNMTELHRALQVEKAAPADIVAILTRLGFEDISERAEAA